MLDPSMDFTGYKDRGSSLPDKILDGLYLGDADNAAGLKSLGITHVLSVKLGAYKTHGDQFTYKIVDILDWDDADIYSHFESCLQFIDHAKKSGGGVLVHCGAGVSRSATVVIAYLMFTMKISYTHARKIVEKSRPMIEPNDGFVQQLLRFEKEQGLLEGSVKTPELREQLL